VQVEFVGQILVVVHVVVVLVGFQIVVKVQKMVYSHERKFVQLRGLD
ncbi:hypothetical protein A2U01_0100570, partial [Trifolium medium]|nr:hypothetical protein [Trifolium medium]